MAFAISGAKTSSWFDANGSIPGTNVGGTPPTISSNALDAIGFGFEPTNVDHTNTGGGYVLLNPACAPSGTALSNFLWRYPTSLAAGLHSVVAYGASAPQTPMFQVQSTRGPSSMSSSWKTLKIGGGGFCSGLDVHPTTGILFAGSMCSAGIFFPWVVRSGDSSLRRRLCRLRIVFPIQPHLPAMWVLIPMQMRVFLKFALLHPMPLGFTWPIMVMCMSAAMLG